MEKPGHRDDTGLDSWDRLRSLELRAQRLGHSQLPGSHNLWVQQSHLHGLWPNHPVPQTTPWPFHIFVEWPEKHSLPGSKKSCSTASVAISQLREFLMHLNLLVLSVLTWGLFIFLLQRISYLAVQTPVETKRLFLLWERQPDLHPRFWTWHLLDRNAKGTVSYLRCSGDCFRLQCTCTHPVVKHASVSIWAVKTQPVLSPDITAWDVCPSAPRPLGLSEWLSLCMRMPGGIQVNVRPPVASNQQS